MVYTTIQNNAETTGGELYLNGQEYIGFYNIQTSGSEDNLFYFTERTYSSSSLELMNSNSMIGEYATISDIKIGIKPPAFRPSPTDIDYKRMWFNRYFAKQSNDHDAAIIEISEDTYNKLKSKDDLFDWALYSNVATLRWKIYGTIDDGVKVNKKTIIQTEKIMPGMRTKLGNLLEFYRSIPISPIVDTTSPSYVEKTPFPTLTIIRAKT